MNHNPTETCANCRCWLQTAGDLGECRPGPPLPELALAADVRVHVAWAPMPGDGWCAGWQPCPVVNQSAELLEKLRVVTAERDEARRICEGLAERVANQSDLLTQRAVKRDRDHED